MNLSLFEPPLTVAKLKKIPTVLRVHDCYDCREIPPGILIIMVSDPELNDLIREILPVGVIPEFITWSFQPA
jgi:hypothetical protein